MEQKKVNRCVIFFVPVNSPQNGLTCLGGAFKYFFFTPTWGNDPI